MIDQRCCITRGKLVDEDFTWSIVNFFVSFKRNVCPSLPAEYLIIVERVFIDRTISLDWIENRLCMFKILSKLFVCFIGDRIHRWYVVGDISSLTEIIEFCFENDCLGKIQERHGFS